MDKNIYKEWVFHDVHRHHQISVLADDCQKPEAFYACVNRREAYCPREIANQTVCIDGDIEAMLYALAKGEV